MATNSPNVPEAKAQMQQLEHHVAEMSQMLHKLVALQTAQSTPNILPSVLNPGSKGFHGSPIPKAPPEQTSNIVDTQHIKSMSPNEFNSDYTRGRAFLNSCGLYTALAPHKFTDNHLKIMWAFSFMKGGRAAHFMNHHMWCYHD
jgi:hypothetical protein